MIMQRPQNLKIISRPLPFAATPIATKISPSIKSISDACVPLFMMAYKKFRCSKKLEPWCNPSYLQGNVSN
ncbi:hypothetical protein SOVF_199450 [Spinacia oleracea]|nr:hypothetical protein SOVF_199450 [Spinacia oleracea]